MKTIENQSNMSFENNCVFEIRNYLQIDQNGFGDALGMQQSRVSIIELGKIKLTPKVKTRICNTFFIDPLYFEEGSGADMFLEGKEEEAWRVANNYRKQKSTGGARSKTDAPKVDSFDLQAIIVEKLERENELKTELLRSKEDMILILKDQLNQMNTNYENLYKEFSELKKFISENIANKIEEIGDHVSPERTDNPNGRNPARNSG